MPLERVESLDDPRLADYRHVPDPERLRRGDVFVAEGRLVVRTLLAQSPLQTRSVLLTDNARRGLADVIEAHVARTPIFVVSAGAIESLTGYNIHRGCLAIGARPERTTVARTLERLATAERLVVLEQVGNADNVGGIFRNAAAFGADAVVIGPGCCDPLYRKAIRVSMGAALRVPFCHADDWMAALEAVRAAGFTIAALTPAPDAVDIGHYASALSPGARIAVLAGSEGAGLSPAAIAQSDVALRIPMDPATDSLNVATATGIVLHRLFPRR
jgi:tRNA G18 (ribose-2'-O)-methylase SpoU